ncbi:MAG TPA: electron transfer flavoprotein subunit alpha/FixB family protein, partial [Propionibacteriaceae bacterium]|nr:electron transfer flavoprotein subunit alpha/FixB family protein [Propionibacteriaceae bacterium]
MSVVLVVTELADSKASKPALELLTLARRLGDPVAVVLGGGAEGAAQQLGQYGATRVLSVVDPALSDYLVAPKAEAVAQVAAAESPAAILISATPEGKEIAGRVAVKLNSGLITDAI